MATLLYAFVSVLITAIAVGLPLLGVRVVEHKLR
jgi:hypothetical protein